MPDYRLGKLGGEFVAKWEDETGSHRWKLGVKTSNAKHAYAALAEFIRKRDLLTSDTEQMTIEHIFPQYLADREAEGKSITRMKDAWKALAPHFALNTFPDLYDGTRVRDYTTRRREQGISDGTIHTELLFLRAAINRIGKRYRVVALPQISSPPKPRPRNRWLTPSEARRLLKATRTPHLHLYVLLALYTAGRPSSILDLTWDRVTEKQIQLDNPFKERTRKGRATVPLHKALVKPLDIARQGALTEYVIEWNEKRVHSVKKGIERSVQRAGLKDVTAYTLRHTSAVWLAQGGVPMEKIREYLGHESIETTIKNYAKFHPEFLHDGADAIDEALRSA